MLYVSQPKGVGFSYCDNATSAKECVNNDLTAAQDAYDFFLGFFERFPELKNQDFYLTAESYGGIYIPMFMVRKQHTYPLKQSAPAFIFQAYLFSSPTVLSSTDHNLTIVSYISIYLCLSI